MPLTKEFINNISFNPVSTKSFIKFNDTEDFFIKPLMIIGYPKNFQDNERSLPIVKSGFLASSYKIPFKSSQFFIIDSIGVLHGSSGSPVFISPWPISLNNGGIINMGKISTKLIGIISKTHSYYYQDGRKIDSSFKYVVYVKYINKLLEIYYQNKK